MAVFGSKFFSFGSRALNRSCAKEYSQQTCRAVFVRMIQKMQCLYLHRFLAYMSLMTTSPGLPSMPDPCTLQVATGRLGTDCTLSLSLVNLVTFLSYHKSGLTFSSPCSLINNLWLFPNGWQQGWVTGCQYAGGCQLLNNLQRGINNSCTCIFGTSPLKSMETKLHQSSTGDFSKIACTLLYCCELVP